MRFIHELIDDYNAALVYDEAAEQAAYAPADKWSEELLLEDDCAFNVLVLVSQDGYVNSVALVSPLAHEHVLDGALALYA